MNKLHEIKSFVGVLKKLEDDGSLVESTKVLMPHFEWLISQVETLKEIQQVMGFSHADSFNEHEAIEEIKTILNYH